MRRQLDAEPFRQLGDPGELVRGGWNDRAAQALDPSLEVDEGPVALEVARPRQDEVGPAARESLEHADREHRLRLLGEPADVRVGGGLVAGDDEQLDRLRIAGGLVGGARPGVRNAAAVRGRGQVEGAGALLLGEAELAGEPGERDAAVTAGSRP